MEGGSLALKKKIKKKSCILLYKQVKSTKKITKARREIDVIDVLRTKSKKKE